VKTHFNAQNTEGAKNAPFYKSAFNQPKMYENQPYDFLTQ
jgi:hypothetical protein